jgi:hypothetical protein
MWRSLLVGGTTWNIRKPQGLLCKMTAETQDWPVQEVWLGGLGRSGSSVRWWTASAAVRRVVDVVTGPWWAGPRGLRPGLIWAVDRRSGVLGRMHARAAAGQRRPAAGRRRLAGFSPETHEHGFPWPNSMGKVPKRRGVQERFTEALAPAG